MAIQFPVYILSALLPAADNGGILCVFGDEDTARDFAAAGGLVNGSLTRFDQAASFLAYLLNEDHSRIRAVWSLPEIHGREVRFRERVALPKYLEDLRRQVEQDSKAGLN